MGRAVRSRPRAGDRRLVALLQPGALARARGRARPDRRRCDRDTTGRSPVHRERAHGSDAAPLLRPGLQPRPGRLGRGQPPARGRTEDRGVSRQPPSGRRRVHAGAHRRGSRRGGLGSALAVDADGRGALAGANQRRAGGAPAGGEGPGFASRGPGGRESGEGGFGSPGREGPRGGTRTTSQRRASVRSRRSLAAGDRDRVAGLSRARSRRRRPRHENLDGLGRGPARRDVAPPHRSWLVVLRGEWRSRLHPGAARQRGGGLLLQARHRGAGVEAHRSCPVLGVERRRGPARDPGAGPPPRLRPSATVASTRWAPPES
jgi:hypothetical protein